MPQPADRLPAPRLPTARDAAGVILAGAAAISAPLAVFAPLGLAPLLAVAALGLVACDPRAPLAAASRHVPLAALLLLLSLWGALSALWSPVPGHSLLEGARLLAVSAAGLVVFAAARTPAPARSRRLALALVAGVALALLLLQSERNDGEVLAHLLADRPAAAPLDLARYDRGVTLLLLAAWPALLALATRFGGWAALAGAAPVAATLVEFASATAALAGLLGLLAFPLGARLPRLAAAGLVGVLLALALVLPLTAPDGDAIAGLQAALPSLKPSAVHRLAIWRFTAERIAERPILGWGMDASRALPGGRTPVAAAMTALRLPATAESLPLHPHDAALQWRVELGLPGALAAIALIALILWRLAGDRGLSPATRGFCFAYAASAATVASLSFGVWQAWWLSALWLTASWLAALAMRPVPGPG
jgi:O-antigen ligase